MVLTGRQIREARALLGWGSPTLARRAKVGFEVVIRAQNEGGMPPVTVVELQAIRNVLERAGIEFVSGSGGAGVQLQEADTKRR